MRKRTVCCKKINCRAGAGNRLKLRSLLDCRHPDFRGKGLGKILLDKSEQIIRQSGGTRIYVDTSMRVQYASTRAFYEHCGYQLESVLEDFYAPGEAKAIYCKSI